MLPLLALTFFSPGLRAERVAGGAVFAFGLATLIPLFVSAREHKRDLFLVVVQVLLLALVIYETLSDARLYIGT